MADRYVRDPARVQLLVGGRRFDGWTSCEVGRSLEAIAGTFSVPVSLVPGQPRPISRGQQVQVLLGDKPVVNGYVLAAQVFYSRNDCGLMVSGRDRAGDLVRCSAIHRGGQWRRAGLERIATDLVAPFGLAVRVETDLGDPIQDFKLQHGETVVEALARAARLRGVLVTRSDEGQVLLTRAGNKLFPGVIRRGWNVVDLREIGSDEDRHSEYIVYGQSITADSFEAARGLKARALDPEMGRYLPLLVNAQGNVTATELRDLAEHTLRVRRGHSMGFRYRVEGWTFQGEPWPVGQRVLIEDDVAGIPGEEWLITSARATLDVREGDVTELVVRPVESYDSRPLRTRVKRKNWGNRGNRTNHPRGPTDRATGG